VSGRAPVADPEAAARVLQARADRKSNRRRAGTLGDQSLRPLAEFYRRGHALCYRGRLVAGWTGSRRRQAPRTRRQNRRAALVHQHPGPLHSSRSARMPALSAFCDANYMTSRAAVLGRARATLEDASTHKTSSNIHGSSQAACDTGAHAQGAHNSSSNTSEGTSKYSNQHIHKDGRGACRLLACSPPTDAHAPQATTAPAADQAAARHRPWQACATTTRPTVIAVAPAHRAEAWCAGADGAAPGQPRHCAPGAPGEYGPGGWGGMYTERAAVTTTSQRRTQLTCR
jgi:hypothetical protein